MWFDSIESLREDGFKGFINVQDLRISRKDVPPKRGVYLVLYLSNEWPKFVTIGTGGWYRSDPNENIKILENNWIEGAIVIYIGQAGSKPNKDWSKTTLRKRLSLYMRYGQGKGVAHEGGRNIWQIENNQNLVLCWKSLPGMIEKPKDVESNLIREFKNYYGDLPFANWQQ
jgi:hypothetical protein